MNGGAPHTLDDLQRWMQSVILHPGGVAAGVESDEARSHIDVCAREIESVIGRSQALSATERLEIYSRAYIGRLVDCLREEYAVLAATLGEELFDTFAVSYLQRYPSTSYTLARLGDRFPNYLAETRPTDETTDDADWPEFLIDLARLEQTVNIVFDGPGVEGERLLDPERLLAIAPEHWSDSRLECVPCLKLLALSYPVNDYFTAIRNGEQPLVPERSLGFVAVTRRDYRVYRHTLVAAQYELLGALQAGETVGGAIARAAQASTAADDSFADDLREWFRTSTAAGFFRSTY